MLQPVDYPTRESLLTMKVSELKKAFEFTAAQVDEADDSGNTQAALIAMILDTMQQEHQKTFPSAGARSSHELYIERSLSSSHSYIIPFKN